MEQEQLDTLKERIHAFMREDAYRPCRLDRQYHADPLRLR